MRVKSSEVVVTHRVPGFHYWPGAPDHTSYLRHRHRHLFMVVVGFKVEHDDRQVEFHEAQEILRGLYDPNHDFGAKSCEHIAKDVAANLAHLELEPSFVEVWEDEENGARVEFTHP